MTSVQHECAELAKRDSARGIEEQDNKPRKRKSQQRKFMTFLVPLLVILLLIFVTNWWISRYYLSPRTLQMIVTDFVTERIASDLKQYHEKEVIDEKMRDQALLQDLETKYAVASGTLTRRYRELIEERAGPTESFDVTILVAGEKGSHDLVLRNSGVVWITLGNDRRNERIDYKGQAEFKNIPAKFRTQEVAISVEAPGFEPANPSASYSIGTGSVTVVIRRAAARLSGRVQDSEGRPVANAKVRVANVSASADEKGRFTLVVPGDVAGSLEAEVSATGFQIWRGRLAANAGDAAIMLNRNPNRDD